MEQTPRKSDFKAKLAARLHDPLQLRIAVCTALLTAWYFAGFTPMKDRIDATLKLLERDRKRLALATEIETLRNEASRFADRLPPRSDPNEFLQYVLSGVRSGPLKLISLVPNKFKEAGPYEVATVKIELEGKYSDADALLQWVENDKRLLRIDSVKLEPDTRNPDLLKVQLAVLGLMGVEENAKKAAKEGNPAEKKPTPEKPGAEKSKATVEKPPPPAKKPAG